MNKEKFRIFLTSYDNKVLDAFVGKVASVVMESGAKVAGPIPMPTKKKIYTVLRSPHKDKDSRNQYQMKIHKRVLEVSNSNPKSMSALSSFSLPDGVGIQIKQI